MSVPNQLVAEGGRRRWRGLIWTGSVVPSHGARSATTAIRHNSTRPSAAVGWRRPSLATPAQAPRGPDPAAGDSASGALIGSVADPGIEDRVEEIHGEVD